MKTANVMTALSINDFNRYFDERRLGNLYFPNGRCIIPNGPSFSNADFPNFFVSLTDLYKMISNWKVNSKPVLLQDIIAIVAFGSAVRYPGVADVIYQRRRYILFGEKVSKVRQEPIQPSDADFLVITEQNLMTEEILEPISLNTYDCGTWIKKGGIHIINRGVNQLLQGIKANDTVSSSAMNQGIPIFFDSRFNEMIQQSGLVKITPRDVSWQEDDRGLLSGKID